MYSDEEHPGNIHGWFHHGRRGAPERPCRADGPPWIERFCCGIFDHLCCPDPCYEACWCPEADAAFSVDAVRPVTQLRFRWDAGLSLVLPDRAEYFWARADGNGRGPQPPPGRLAVDRVRYHDFSLYSETAVCGFSFIVDAPYRSVFPEPGDHHANFGDLRAGIKSMVFDRELLQVGWQFLTYIPTGGPGRGTGTGHVSLEPSLLVGLRLSDSSYFQGQVAEWIPIDGDSDYQGAILHYHASLNQVFHRFHRNVTLVGTAEFNGWTFHDGAYTDPVLGPGQRAGGETYLSAGPGIRLFICDRFDFGFSALFALTDPHFAAQLYRTEVRWRF